jgi:PAS domain S-box-containing protein
MPAATTSPVRPDDAAALRFLVEGTAGSTGEQFFVAVVENLARVLATCGAWVTEYFPERRMLRAKAFLIHGQWRMGYEYAVDGTPCEPVIDRREMIHIAENLAGLFPEDLPLQRLGAVSYMAMPLFDEDGNVMGHLGVLDNRPMPQSDRNENLLRIFAARTTAEMLRLRAESNVRQGAEKLSRLVATAMDAIVELDGDLAVTLFNPAAEKIFHCSADEIAGTDFCRFLDKESAGKLRSLANGLSTGEEGKRHIWVPGGFTLRSARGGDFPAEATMGCSSGPNGPFFTLILRDLNDRIEAERRIRSLTDEAEYLKEELRELRNPGDIAGQSDPLRRALREVQQVAETDSTVLLLGETGTGKELFARAIHASSRRRDRPLIRVNCAAIPAQLMESEFFGHERGAFTGATARREGRFALADGGTIFLDEIGELPLELQAKLLRVLQEGELEPVGSSHTRKVDVRVLAATNRDLLEMAKQGKFREDLYYRLNVFPLRIPPLRERGGDVLLLARDFIRHFSQRMGKPLLPLAADQERRLRAYPWPGNVRELQNVIERAVITSRDGRLDLDRALPESAPAAVPEASQAADEQRIHTVQELESLERDNIVRALDACDWRIAGERGAARLLGMNPSTLASRIKALGINRRT